MKVKYIIVVTSICLLTVTIVQAQSKRPSELRKEQRSEEIQGEVFSDEDPNFRKTQIPDKWKNESAVILYAKMDYSFLRDNDILKVNETLRRSIKLLDQASIDEFSEFYYRDAYDIGVRIIKPDGKIVKVNTTEAVKVTTEVPDFFKPYYKYSDSYYKLAIPNLEKGDIIDYFYRATSTRSNFGYEIAFDPFLFTLNSTYPSLGQKINFTVDRGFYLNLGSYNDAPKFTQGGPGLDARGRKNANIKTYELIDSERDKRSSVMWDNAYAYSPFVKFQVIYVSPRYAKSTQYFIGEVNEAKTQVSAEEIQQTVLRQFAQNSMYGSHKDVLNYLNRYHRKSNDPEVIAGVAYNYMRYLLLRDYYNYYSSEYDNLENGLISVKEYKFITTLYEVLIQRGIKAEVVAALPASLGKIENVLLSDEIQLGLRVDGKDGFYMFPFNNHTSYDYMPADLEGAEAYVFSPARGQNSKIEKIIIPKKSPNDHHAVMAMQIEIDGEFKKLAVTQKNTLSGQYKTSYAEVALYGYDYLLEDVKNFNPEYKEDVPRGNSKRLAEEKRKEEARLQEKLSKKKEIFKKLAEDDFEVLAYHDISLIQHGRYEPSSDLVFEEKLDLGGLISKAGKNHLLEVGKLIGGQVALKEEEQIRTKSAYLTYARSIEHEIVIALPEGCTVKGLEDLNMQVDNNVGAFISKATIEGNKIRIKTKKQYKNKVVEKEAWQDMLAFLNAAYNFSQKKVILEKNAQIGQ